MFDVRQLSGVGVGGASLKSISDFAICHEISFHNAKAAAAQVPAGGGAEEGRGVWITTVTPSFGAH